MWNEGYMVKKIISDKEYSLSMNKMKSSKLMYRAFEIERYFCSESPETVVIIKFNADGKSATIFGPKGTKKHGLDLVFKDEHSYRYFLNFVEELNKTTLDIE